MPTAAPKTDAEAALVALGEARTWEQARERYLDLAPTVYPTEEAPAVATLTAEADFFAALGVSLWPIMLAPEIWAVLQEWQAVKRIEKDIKQIRQVAAHIRREMREPNVWRVVEVAKEGGPERIGPDGQLVEVVTRGPDVLSVRGKEAIKGYAEAIKGEDLLARARQRFAKAVDTYHASLVKVEAMTAEELRLHVLRRAVRKDLLPVAAAALAASPTPPADGASDDLLSGLEKRLRKAGKLK